MTRRSHESRIDCSAHKFYKLTCDDYDALWARCAGQCEACGDQIDLTKQDHAIDHDHRYGVTAVRGIVCSRCNAHLRHLETPRIRPTFTRGPGRWFASYFSRAWFLRHANTSSPEPAYVDHEQFRAEMRSWTTYNRHLFTRDPKATVVPTDQVREIIRILRAAMSPQAFARLAKLINEEAAVPKKMPPWSPPWSERAADAAPEPPTRT